MEREAHDGRMYVYCIYVHMYICEYKIFVFDKAMNTAPV